MFESYYLFFLKLLQQDDFWRKIYTETGFADQLKSHFLSAS